MAVLSRSGYGYPRPGALFGLIAKLSHRQSLGKRVVGEVTTRRDSSARHVRSASEGQDTIVPARGPRVHHDGLRTRNLLRDRGNGTGRVLP